MAVISQLELATSPREAPSYAASVWFWDPTGDLQTGETISAPTGKVYQYDPAFADNVADYKDVTATVLSGGAFTVGSGSHANMVQVSILANTLVVGYEYRVQMSCTGSLGSTPSRFFRLRVRV